jgi:hypothetical protein
VPAIFHLLGLPGVGKFTIASRLVDTLDAAGETARLIDNHLTADAVVCLVPEPFPGGRMDLDVLEGVGRVREVVFDLIERISPPSWSFVLTNFVAPHDSLAGFSRIRQLAERRQSTYVPVHLECDVEEGLRRVVRPDRAVRSKLRDAQLARELYDRGPLIPEWPDLFRLDVTRLAPEESAARIIGHRDTLA